MGNSKLGLIVAKRQHFISRSQRVESEISSPPALLNAEPFLADMRSLLGNDAARFDDSSNAVVIIRSKQSTGERK